MDTADEFDYQILMLSDLFYNTYPNPPHLEILKKQSRSYNCILFQTQYDYLVCIPYRTEISHKYAYKFTSSQRSIDHKSGLDYTKMVIVKNMDYICPLAAVIDQDEYVETVHNIKRIKDEAIEFLYSYVNHIDGSVSLHHREFSRRFGFSPLKYFHPELGL
jgi:hypothetical protein